MGRGVAKVFYMRGPIFDNDDYHHCMENLYFYVDMELL